jgi:nitroimidazol reductase NimA-like FMN-containing flavoprotein (pyridoxamine 5'-phosphate oxidase superfamily)
VDKGGAMKQKTAAMLVFEMLVLLFVFPALYCAEQAAAPAAAKASPGKAGEAFAIQEGRPITSGQVMSQKHPPFARGMVCVECHTVNFDAVTSSTRQYINNYPQLKNDAVWNKIEAFLPGRERFSLATVYNNEPTDTTVDMVLDKKDKVFYVVCEKGTEKLYQIKQNPKISAVHYAGWTVAGGGKKEWKSVQVRGTAEVILSGDARYGTIIDKYHLARLSRERAVLRFDLIRITPSDIVYFDTNLADENAGIYQRWERNK